MLDMHSHILPGIDDGAKTAEDSLKLLEQMRDQGVTVAVATAHFYPDSAVLEEFLSRRQDALKCVRQAAGEDFPVKILPGAEVLYFGGIGKFEGIKQLALGKTRYILLELSGLEKIDDKVITDLISVREEQGLTPVIAHTERYCKYKGFKKLLALISEGKALCQINATFKSSRAEYRAVKRLVKAGLVDFLASDCHSPVDRPVRLSSAYASLREISPEKTEKIIAKTNELEKELMSLD